MRHWFIKGDVLWTEEGHRLSWRMMLRHRTGSATFIVSDKKSGERIPFNLTSLLSPMQIKQMKTRPDMIWQTAQHIKTDFEKEGREVSVRVLARTSINNGAILPLINPEIDLCEAKWDYFWHNEWVMLYPEKNYLNTRE